MATKNLVPRIADEGKLGISTKKWEEINALTGSFSNISASGFISASSFAGDGSGIIGVTAEWDGTHGGNGNITGVLTVQAVSASGNISSSGNLYLDGFISASGNISTSGNFYSSGNLEITHISASGNISGSATSTGSFGRLEVVGNFVPTMGVGFTETPAEPQEKPKVRTRKKKAEKPAEPEAKSGLDDILSKFAPSTDEVDDG